MENVNNVNNNPEDNNNSKKPEDDKKNLPVNNSNKVPSLTGSPHPDFYDDDEDDYEDEENLVKRYVPISCVGSFMCSHCIVEAAKNYVLVEFPEIAYVETHMDDDEYDSPNEMTQIAMKCLIILVKKFSPQHNIFFLDANQLVNNKHPGVVFIGRNIEEMSFEETKIDFIERTRMDLLNLQVFNKKEEKNKDNLSESVKLPDNIHEEHEHEIDSEDDLEIGQLLDVYTVWEERENEDDKDDYERGHEDGIGVGIDINNEWVQVSLYKMFKMKKIKNLDFLIEEIKNTIGGMGTQEFRVWQQGFLKHTLKRQEKIEKEEKGE